MRKYYRDEKGMKQVGERIREIRIIKKISQAELAIECETDYSQVNRMELGKVDFTLSSLLRIAKALQVHPTKLLSEL